MRRERGDRRDVRGGSALGQHTDADQFLPEPEHITNAQLEEVGVRLLDHLPFRDRAPLSAAGAAAVILDGVRSGAWRILGGDDAKMIDAAVRARPEAAYDYTELFGPPRGRSTPDKSGL